MGFAGEESADSGAQVLACFTFVTTFVHRRWVVLSSIYFLKVYYYYYYRLCRSLSISIAALQAEGLALFKSTLRQEFQP